MDYFEVGIFGIKKDKIFRIEDENYDNYDLIIAKDYLPEELPDKFVLILWRYDFTLIEELNKRLNELRKRSVIITNNFNHSIEFLKEVLDNIKGVWVEDYFGEKVIYGKGEHMLVWEFYSIEHLLNVLEKEVKFRYYLLKKKKISDNEFTNIFFRYVVLKKFIENLERIKKNFEVYIVPLPSVADFTEPIDTEKLLELMGIKERILLNIAAWRKLKFNTLYIYLRDIEILLKMETEDPLLLKRELDLREACSWSIPLPWEEFTYI